MNRRSFLKSGIAAASAALPAGSIAGNIPASVAPAVNAVSSSSAGLKATFDRYMSARSSLRATEAIGLDHPDYVEVESKLWAKFYDARARFFAHPCATQQDALAKSLMVFEDDGGLLDDLINCPDEDEDFGMSPLQAMMRTIAGQPVELRPDCYERHLADQVEMAQAERERCLKRKAEKATAEANAPRFAKFDDIPADLIPADIADEIKALDRESKRLINMVGDNIDATSRIKSALLATLNGEAV